jgi:hypothetical protein
VAIAFALVVLAVIGLILIGVLPIWPFSRGWGYGPAVIIGLVLFILLVMTLTGRVPGMGEVPRTRALRSNNTQVRGPPSGPIRHRGHARTTRRRHRCHRTSGDALPTEWPNELAERPPRARRPTIPKSWMVPPLLRVGFIEPRVTQGFHPPPWRRLIRKPHGDPRTFAKPNSQNRDLPEGGMQITGIRPAASPS